MTHLRPDAEVVAAYLDLRRRVIELLRRTPENRAGSPVPHCPAWTVHDVVAHLVGVPDDILAGRMEGVTTDAWTEAQVDRHRQHSLADLAEIWADGITAFDSVLPHIPSPVNSQFVMDAVTHEHDLRHALGEPGARDSGAVHVAVGWLLDMAEARVPGMAAGLVGSEVGLFDLLRVLSGRRSADQISRLGLDGPGIVAMLAGSPLRPPTIAVDE
jgi:uncharacterized protein (TIGR03083 family)